MAAVLPLRLAADANPACPAPATAADGPRAPRLAATRPSAHVRRWSFDRSLGVGAGVEPATDAFRARCSSTELANDGGEPGVEPGPLRAEPMHHHSVASGKAACAAPTDESGCRTPAGFTNPWPFSVCLRRQTLERLERFGSGAIPSAGARPATRARRRGCAGLRAGNPRSGSAHTAGTRAELRTHRQRVAPEGLIDGSGGWIRTNVPASKPGVEATRLRRVSWVNVDSDVGSRRQKQPLRRQQRLKQPR